MAGMKSWLEKIKNRILKKDLDDDLVKSKIQSEEKIANDIAIECLKENELPDLITPTSEKIDKEKTTRKGLNDNHNETQKPREEAIRLNEMHEYERNKIIESELVQMQCAKGFEKDFVHFTDVPKRTKTA